MSNVNKQDDHGSHALARNVSRISRFTLLSRVLGLARDQLFAALVGAGQGMHADAFFVAFRIPNLLRDLFAEGALSAALAPTYACALREDGREQAQRLIARLMTLLTITLAALIALGWLAAPAIVHVLAPGFERITGKTELTILLTRIMMPFLLLVSLAAVTMGVLNTEQRYEAPAFAPAMFNIIAIVVGVSLWGFGLSPRHVVMGWAAGALLGALAQLAIQIPGVLKLGWRPRFEWAPFDSRIRQILKLMAPATIGLAAVEINIVIGSNFASHEQGAQAWLLNAFRILYLPIGLFGVAIGTVVTAESARQAAAGDLDGLRQCVRRSLRMAFFVSIPATAGLMVLAQPIVRMLFEHGRYQPADTAKTSLALFVYSIGLVAYSAVKVVVPAFYSLKRARLPVFGSLAAVTTSLAVMAVCYPIMGYAAVALGTSVGAFMNIGVLMCAFQRHVGGLRGAGLGEAAFAMAQAAAVMAICVHLAARGCVGIWGSGGLFAQIAAGTAPVAVGVFVYLASALALRIPEARVVMALLGRHGRRQTVTPE
ncbi:MAG: murein biosynthesis integral membrane protein MurJ [Vicinamibacteria bacterium]|nr:murein biosynthesis integral membrane protein MurJ [Vicinamibacteria bacterium]